MLNIKTFEDGMYYICTGNGQRWSDYDGPFDSIEKAISYLALLSGDYATPEMLGSVLVFFKDNVLDLVKDDNKQPINGKAIFFKKTIRLNEKVIWEPSLKQLGSFC